MKLDRDGVVHILALAGRDILARPDTLAGPLLGSAAVEAIDPQRP